MTIPRKPELTSGAPGPTPANPSKQLSNSGAEMRKLVSKLEGGCMFARFHLTRLQGPEREPVGQAQVQMFGEFDCFVWGGFCQFVGRFDGSWTCCQKGFDRNLSGI